MPSSTTSPPVLSRYGTRSMAAKVVEAPKLASSINGTVSSPLSSPNSTPEQPSKRNSGSGKNSPTTRGEEEPSKHPRVTLRYTRPQPEGGDLGLDFNAGQSSLKRKRAVAAQVSDKKSKQLDVMITTATAVRNQPRGSISYQETTSKTPVLNTAIFKPGSTNTVSSENSASKNRVTKKTSPGNATFSETAITSYALREIYDAIPQLPKDELKMKWVPVKTRREVFELVKQYANSKSANGHDCKKQLQAIKLDLNLWEEDTPQVCKVRYPLFERVMEKLLFWIERGRVYKADKKSVAKHQDALAAKAARVENILSEEELLRDAEIESILNELQALEQDMPIGGLAGDSTHHRFRAGILNVAYRFCTEQSRVGLDCTKIIQHLRADLHLCADDVKLMKEGKLATLSMPDIHAISQKLPAWFRGDDVYVAGRRAVDMYTGCWYQEYKAVHLEMVKLGLFVR